MQTQDLLVLLQIGFTVVVGAIGWGLKTVLENNLQPIKNDIKMLSNDVSEMKDLWKLHASSTHPHPLFEERLNDKFVPRTELDLTVKRLDDKIK